MNVHFAALRLRHLGAMARDLARLTQEERVTAYQLWLQLEVDPALHAPVAKFLELLPATPDQEEDWDS